MKSVHVVFEGDSIKYLCKYQILNV